MWTDEAVACLRKEWAAGLTASQIARELWDQTRFSTTRNAVIGKVHRLGLAGRMTPIDKTKRERIARARRRAIKRMPKFRAVPVDLPATLAEIKALAPIDPTLDVTRLNAFTCRFPIGDPSEPGFAFCGRTCSLAGPYCADHTRLTYIPVTKRRTDNLARLATWLDARGRQVRAA